METLELNEKVPMEMLFTDEYLKISEGGKVKAILKKHEIINEGGFSDNYREQYFAKTGMETGFVDYAIKSGDVNFYNVMALAVRGMSKRAISAQTSLAERSVEKIIYCPAGQAFLRATLSETNVITCSVLPTLAATAYATLEDCLQGKADKSRLAAVEVTLGLISRLEKMAAVTVDYKKTKIVKASSSAAV